ncbi:hypothetical protein [Halorussus marinus]|uniref:hypothetical protein n=1 Tax=Halorussus marinus TaxID=2505976 RepID=UPI00106E8D61|nr:hypothetical protein [Halorussus marinus]
MTDPDGENGRMYRRTVLKGTAAAGLFGLTGVASASDYREVTFTSADDDLFEYKVKVSGKMKRGGTYESDPGDEVGHDYAHGRCAEGRSDSFLWTGEIVDLQLSGRGKVYVDGELVEDTTGEKDHDGGDDKDDHDGKTREVTFTSVSDEIFRYRVEVSGKMMRGGTYESDPGDEVGDNYANGRAADGRSDSFLWTGEVVELKVGGPGKVYVDGELVEDTTTDGDLSKEVIVSNPGSDELREYTLRVTGDARMLEPDEDFPPADDEIVDLDGGGARIEGAVSTGDDRFAFSGDLIRENVPDGVQIDVRNR